MNLDLSLDSFLDLLGEHRRAFLVWDDRARVLATSDPRLDAIAREIEIDRRDFDEHEAIFLERGAQTGALFGAFLHKTVRGQGAGGVRHWPYPTIGAFLHDGLRLSRGMGRKNALAGLWWGGGKGIIARQNGNGYRDPAYRALLYQEYGRFITSLSGCYVTAEDVGTNAADMAEIFKTTRFVTCVPSAVGGSGNPSPATARGVVCAIRAALGVLGLGDLSGKRIVMQGTGNVGSSMIDYLLEGGAAHVLASEIDETQRDRLAERFRGKPVELRLVLPRDTDIFREPCDVFVPNALGGVLNPETIPLLQARLVCGAANNQLLDEPRDAELLAARNIAYVPDFVANRMGIVSCANEQYGTSPNDPAILRHFDDTWESSIASVTRDVFERAARDRVTTARAGSLIADELARMPHPLFGHRSLHIVQALVKGNWHRRADNATAGNGGAGAVWPTNPC